MKKICFFNSEKKWGGGEKWHFETARALRKNGYKVVILGNINSELVNKCKKENLKVKEIKISNKSFFNPVVIYKIIKFFRQEKISTTVANLPTDMKIMSLTGIFYKKNKKIYRRGSAIPIRKTFFNKLCLGKLVDTIIVNSYETKNTVIKNMNLKQLNEKIKVIYNYFDFEVYKEEFYEEVHIKKENEIIIGNLARLSKQKGQENFIEIAKYLKNNGIKYKIYLAGTGELYDELNKKIKKEKLEKEIILLGFIKNVKLFLEKIDVFAFTSIWEGFGYSLVEAMYFNKPIVAYNASSNLEILEGYSGAKLIEIYDNKSFSEEIVKLNKLKEILKKNRVGQIFVENKFDKNEIIKKIIEIIE